MAVVIRPVVVDLLVDGAPLLAHHRRVAVAMVLPAGHLPGGHRLVAAAMVRLRVRLRVRLAVVVMVLPAVLRLPVVVGVLRLLVVRLLDTVLPAVLRLAADMFRPLLLPVVVCLPVMFHPVVRLVAPLAMDHPVVRLLVVDHRVVDMGLPAVHRPAVTVRPVRSPLPAAVTGLLATARLVTVLRAVRRQAGAVLPAASCRLGHQAAVLQAPGHRPKQSPSVGTR